MSGILKPAFDARVIDCVVCHEPQPMPWRTCTTCGALICEPCVDKIRNAPTMCPLCRQALIWKHNVFAETLAAQYTPFNVPCGHAGCNAEVPFDTLAAHRDVCVSRPRPCPTGKKCPFKGSPREILFHLGSEHNAIPLDAIPAEVAATPAVFRVVVPRTFDHCSYYVTLDIIDGLIFIGSNSFPIEGYVQKTVITNACKQSSCNHIVVASGERTEESSTTNFKFRICEYEVGSDWDDGFGVIATKPEATAVGWVMNLTVTEKVRAKTERDDDVVEQPDTKKTRDKEDKEKKENSPM